MKRFLLKTVALMFSDLLGTQFLTTFVVERSVSIGDLVATELGLKSILKA